MIEFFNESILEDAKKQRKEVLIKYLAIVFVYAIISGVLLGWYLTLPYGSKTIATVKWIHFPLTAVFVVFSFIYLGIYYKRINKYYKLCLNLKNGLKETFEAQFVGYSQMLAIKDGVDCKELIFNEWNKFKEVYYERRVFVLYEMDFPDIPEKSMVKFITQGNVLISYQILNEKENG
ncbi:MAG: hypothetical protein II988_02595 [Clostridia bacterium]|nr:hypothetical protein [Clostridia bacterium]